MPCSRQHDHDGHTSTPHEHKHHARFLSHLAHVLIRPHTLHMCSHLLHTVHTPSACSHTFAMLRSRCEACLQRVVGVVQRPQLGLCCLLWPHEPQQQQRLRISPGDGEAATTAQGGQREVGG